MGTSPRHRDHQHGSTFHFQPFNANKSKPYYTILKYIFLNIISPLLENKAISENCARSLYGCVRNKTKWRRYDSSHRVLKYTHINKMGTSSYIDMNVVVIKQTPRNGLPNANNRLICYHAFNGYQNKRDCNLLLSSLCRYVKLYSL